MKKFVSFLSAAALSGLMPVMASAATYVTPYYQAQLVTTSTISRAEFVQLAMQSTGSLYQDGQNCFTDVRNQQFAMYVCAAKQMGIITGYPNGSYRPNNPITFVEAAAIAVRVHGGLQTVGGATVWYQPYLQQLAAWNSLPTNVQNILAPISHAQALELINALNNRTFDNDFDNDDDSDDDDNDVSDSDDDMKLTITASDDEIDAGDRVTFRIKLENMSDDDIDDIEVLAELDNDMEYISSSDDGEEDDDEVEWDDIEVEEDETKTILLTVEVDEDADEDDVLRLKVTSENGDELNATKSIKVEDGDDDDNDDDEEVSISITDSEDPVQEGDEYTYQIKIENEDDDDIRVDVLAILDEDTSFVSASDDGDESSDEVEWDDIRLDEDESKTLTLRVKVRSSANDGQDLILKVEANDEEEEEETEVEDDDNDDDDTGDEDVDVTISESDDTVQEGDTVIYRIELENNENDDIEVDVRADLDDGMSFLSASLDGRLIGDDEVRWDNIDIDEDDDRVLLLTVRINNKVDDGDTLRLTVEAGEGEDSETTRVED